MEGLVTLKVDLDISIFSLSPVIHFLRISVPLKLEAEFIYSIKRAPR